MDDVTLPLQIGPHNNGSEAQVKQRMEALKRNLSGGKDQVKELKKATEGFETIFLAKLWQMMRSTVPKEGYLHSKEEDHYLSMFDFELAQKLSQSGGIGLGDMLFNQLKSRLTKASQETVSSVPIRPLAQADVLSRQIKAVVSEAQEEPSKPISTEDRAEKVKENVSIQSRVDTLAREIEKRMGRGGAAPAVSHENVIQNVAARAATDLPPMTWPLDGQVSSSFGWRKDPFTAERAWHNGIDLAAPEGTAIKACWPGRVSFVGRKGGYGRTVIIEHDGGFESMYAHNKSNQVKVGQRVRAGQIIGQVGSSGRSTGPHLHFEIRQGLQAFNPKGIEQRILAGLSIGRHV